LDLLALEAVIVIGALLVWALAPLRAFWRRPAVAESVTELGRRAEAEFRAQVIALHPGMDDTPRRAA
jgi:hypothetical protein